MKKVWRVVPDPAGPVTRHLVDVVESVGIVGERDGVCGLSIQLKMVADPIFVQFVDEKHLRGFIADLTETLRLVWPAGDA